MGYNTTVVLFNDMTHRWPVEIQHAETRWARHELRGRRSFDERGYFGWGQIIASEHADHAQVCVTRANFGTYLTPITPVERQEDLDALAEVLRGHGYAVRAPGEKRAQPPFSWGYAAKVARCPTPATRETGETDD